MKFGRCSIVSLTLVSLMVVSLSGCGKDESPAVTVPSLKDRFGDSKGKPDPKVRK